MNIEKIRIGQLLPADYNPRKDLQPGDPEFEKLKRSVEEFGYVEPIIWNKRTGVVVGGHQRLKVLQHLGYTEVECVVLDLDEQKEKARNHNESFPCRSRSCVYQCTETYQRRMAWTAIQSFAVARDGDSGCVRHREGKRVPAV